MTPTPAEAAKGLAASLSEVATALYTVDSSTDTLFVRSLADAGNASAAAVGQSLAAAWQEYPLAKEAVERLEAAVGDHDRASVEILLGPAAVTLPDGSAIALNALVGSLSERVRRLGDESTRIAETARAAVSRLDAALAIANPLFARAAAVDADDDPELTVLRPALDRASEAVATDPTAPAGLEELERAVAAAQQRVETLETQRDQVPALLSSSAERLDEIEALVAEGAEASSRTRSRIESPVGLLEPLDLNADGDRALRPWLARIREEADAGNWERAFKALSAWDTAADGWLETAKRVAEANAAPLARRNELRGLLDAYQAKAAAHGRAEDENLGRLHEAATDALYTAPCALPSAEALVRDYVEAVNDAQGAER